MRSCFRSTLAAVTAVGAALAPLLAGSAHAATGLTESVYHNIYVDDLQATQSDLDKQETYLATATPAYSFTNTATTFAYNYDSGYTVADFLGADGAGVSAVASDTNPGQPGVNETAIVATGTVDVSTPGLYIFSLPTADDAAAVFVGGVLVAEQSYQNGVGLTTPSSGTVDITGPESFELVYYNEGGNADLSYSVTGPGGVSYSTTGVGVPEPATWALMVIGLGAAGAGLRNRRTRQGLATSA
jgi:PEP-CTERM motif